MKIGEIVTIKHPYTIDTGTKKVQVKAGDKGFIDSSGCIHYLTGDAKGKIRKLREPIPTHYDIKSISRLISKRLKDRFSITDDEVFNVTEKDCIKEIQEILKEIL